MIKYEENISAKQDSSKESARVSQEDADDGRAQGFVKQAPQRKKALNAGIIMPRFSRSVKIRTRRDWGRARKAKIRVAGKSLSISVLEGEGQRLGIVVGARVGGAVERNRIKRIFREYFRLNRDKFPNGDCVIVAKPQASKLGNEELREELVAALRKVMK